MSRHTPVAKRGKGEKMGQGVEQPDIPQVVAAPLLPCGSVYRNRRRSFAEGRWRWPFFINCQYLVLKLSRQQKLFGGLKSLQEVSQADILKHTAKSLKRKYFHGARF